MYYKIAGLFSLFLILAISCNDGNLDSAMEQFEGLWKLHRHEIRNSQGQWVEHDWMKDGTGYLLYDGEGHMSMHITPKDYKKKRVNWNYKVDSIQSKMYKSEFEVFSKKDSFLTLSSYVYVANCRILEGNIIEHARLSHGNPERFNDVVQRAFRFHGDTLILSPLNLDDQSERRVKWIRH